MMKRSLSSRPDVLLQAEDINVKKISRDQICHTWATLLTVVEKGRAHTLPAEQEADYP